MKINVSDKAKAFIKENFAELDPAALPAPERSYYNRIKAGKARAASAYRVNGRYIGGEVLTMIESVSTRKGITPDEYIEENRDAIVDMIESGYTRSEGKTPDSVIDLVSNSRRKYFEVETQDGVQRVTKAEAIELIATAQQYITSNTTIVSVGLPVRVYTSGKVRVTVPDFRAKRFKNNDEALDELENTLDDLDIFYIDSPPKGKK